ncbi:helix-turn-helix domain-containing protein [Streptomyces sp. NPDC002602]|uniref:helix-turn-helix domain-containing protein n=1 Tax=Streptomyces sp. NPDC002602 TaxID=3364654 RepID=UPI0036CEECBC
MFQCNPGRRSCGRGAGASEATVRVLTHDHFRLSVNACRPRRTPLPDWGIARRQELGERIAQGRRDLHLSQDQLADRIGLERRSVQRYESGERDPRCADLLLIGHALEVPVEQLVERKQ